MNNRPLGLKYVIKKDNKGWFKKGKPSWNKGRGKYTPEQQKARDLLSSRKTRMRRMKSWEGFFSPEVPCQICGRKIYFNRGDAKTAIHFDHRHENTIIKKSPSEWLWKNERTPKNERIWLDCEFGMLCSRCNSFLPTINRKEFIIKVNEYVFGTGFIFNQAKSANEICKCRRKSD